MLHAETQLQIAVCDLLELCGLYYFHVPNGGQRKPSEAKLFQRMGVKAGVADLVIFIPRRSLRLNGINNINEVMTAISDIQARVAFLELKAPGKKQSLSQRQFQSLVENLGFEYFCSDNLKDITKWLCQVAPSRIKMGER